MQEKKISWEKLLYNEREKKQVRLDDKCLCSWNAIMLKGPLMVIKPWDEIFRNCIKMQLCEAKFLSSRNLFHYKTEQPPAG
jgi:hypothetical protein